MKAHVLLCLVVILAACSKPSVTNEQQAAPAGQTAKGAKQTPKGLPRYMTDIPQPIPEQIIIANAPRTARHIEAFRSLTHTMTMVDVVRQCGVPDEHQGSGVFIFIYHLEDGSIVAIGTADLKRLLYATHIDVSGEAYSLLPAE